MGKGRKAKPPFVRLMEGTRAHGGVKGAEMLRTTPGTPDAPPHLEGLALAHWMHLTEHLGRVGLLERIDGASLEAACVAYGRAVAADMEVTARGAIYIDDKGNPKKHPAVSVSLEAWTQYRHFALEFGLTPCSRAKLRMPKQNAEVDEFSEFVKQA